MFSVNVLSPVRTRAQCHSHPIARVAFVCVLSAVGFINSEDACAQGSRTEAATRQYAAAVGFQNQKLYADAIDEWQTFLKKFPRDDRRNFAQHYLGTCCLQEKRFAEAISAFSAVDNRSQFQLLDQSLLNLGIARYGSAQQKNSSAEFGRADLAFRRMLTKFPRSKYAGRAQFFRGECLFQQKKYADAAAAYSGFLRQFPGHELAAEASYGLGTAWEELGETEKAASVFSSFSQKFPNHKLTGEVRMRRAEALFENQEFRAALPLFAEIAKQTNLASADVAALRQARCLYELKRYSEAARVYWGVPRTFPRTTHYDAAVLAGAKCLFLNKQYALARSGFEKVAKRTKPEAAEATQWLARCFLKENNPAQAMTVIQQGLDRFKDADSRAGLELTGIDAIYEQPGQRHRALDLYAAFARRHPNHDQAAQAQYMAALTALEEKEYAAAKQHSLQFLRKFRRDKLRPDVEFIAAESELLLDNHAAAITKYRSFLKTFPQHESAPQASVRMALALHLSNQHDDAVRLLNGTLPRLTDKSLRDEARSLLGRSYAKLNRLDDAARVLQQTGTGQQSEAALVALADIYREQNRSREAEQQFEHVVRKFPTGEFASEAQFRLAEIAYADERYDVALQRYSDVVRQWPESEFAAHAQYGLGWAYFQKEEFSRTVQTASALLNQHASASKANAKAAKIATKGLYLRAMANYQLGEHRTAINDVTAYLKTNPSTNDALDAKYVQGLALAGLKRFDEAARVYQDILNQAQRSKYATGDQVAYELAWVYLDQQQTSRAVAAFEKLARDYPKSPLASESLFRIGEAWYDAEDYSKAANAYAASASKATDDEIAEKSLHKLGWSYLKAKDASRAARAFKNQIARFANGELAGDGQFLIGESAFQQKDWKAALQAFEQAARLTSSNYQALATFRAGQCSAKLENWSTSQAWHQRVLQQFPDFDMRPEARYGLAWALQNQEQYSNAITMYEAVTEETQTETAAKARFMIGECCFAQKQHKAATKHFLKTAFTYNHPEWSPMAWFEAARCFEVLRDTNQARNCYEQLLKKYPGHAKARDARQRLSALTN